MNNRGDRCRLILTVDVTTTNEQRLKHALAGGDIASIVLHNSGQDSAQFESFCCQVVPAIQASGIAALVANDSQIMDRSSADGIFLDREYSSAKETVARFSPQKIVGFGDVLNRHDALTIGEAAPDFMLFGKVGGDLRARPHPRNVELANWWSDLVEIPCIVMGGNVVDSVSECAASGAEFVALERAVFADGVNPRSKVAEANRLLENFSLTHD